jgi:uncharacterized membrane protein YbhN (UPF0104 family)
VSSNADPLDKLAPTRLALLVALAAVLSAGALTGLVWTVGFGRELHGLTHPHWIWLGIAFAGEFVAYLGYTFAYRDVARAEGGAEFEVPKAAALVASGFGVFVHGGGFALDREALRRAGLSRTDARRRVLGLGVLEYAVLAPAAAVAAGFVFVTRQDVSPSLTLPWVIAVPAGTVLALLALRFRERIGRWPWIGESLGHTLHALRLVLKMFTSRAGIAFAFTGILLYWAGEIFCLWATLHAFSAHTPPVAQLIVGYATGYAATRRALPLGGAGVVEALLPFALGWLAIGLGPALLAVFAYRVINLWVPMVPAIAGIPTLRRLEHPRPRSQRGASQQPG